MRRKAREVNGSASRNGFVVKAFIYLLLSLPFFCPGARAQCPANIGFETGTFDNWVCYLGSIDSFGVITVNPSLPEAGRHTMLTNTYPVTIDPYGRFPVTCPNGSLHSIRLGNDGIHSQAERISYTLTVPPDKDSYSILYNYAVVFQNPEHSDYQQPRFTAKVFDVEANDYIYCSSFDYAASGGLPGFKLAGSFGPGGTVGGTAATDVYYKPWSAVTIPLQGYAGKKLVLEFTTNDCTRGGHFGYAYIDVNEECEGLIGGSVICAGSNNVTLVAPYGFMAYKWYDENHTKLLGEENTITLKPTPAPNTVIALDVVPFPGSGCAATLNTTLKYINVDLTLKTLDSISACTPLTVDLTAPAITAGSSPGLTYSYFTDPAMLNYLASPKNVSETGMYYIKAANEEGCIDIKPIKAILDAVPELSVSDPPAVYWPATVDLVLKTYIQGKKDSLKWTYWQDPATTIPIPNPEKVGAIGTYYLRATTDYGCSDVYPVKVSILIAHPPNAFSPNGDGIHDTWEFPSLKDIYPQSRVDIFDRYGRLLFHSIGYDKYWDGTYKGQPVPVGTYYYVIKPASNVPTLSGSVTVLY